ncbi:hypothetical protein J8C02_04795 [Chloracidobacterium sp. MS 40/45]|uniref:hypothetical protein n=1 Tax=Chloracidobacterium aggregatum TaxID=2851959 RepID=UPI001B8AFF8B|nr:hypothetical protein [Chloracidobacterium aggregatum]QUW00816.1 hypothetical protein J8C02_04795 [Chloracidobacterium sp. MS 40/45]
MEKLLTGAPLTTTEYLSLDDADVPVSTSSSGNATPTPFCLTWPDVFWSGGFSSRLTFLPFRQKPLRRFGPLWSQLWRKRGWPPEFYLLEDDAGDVPYFGPSTCPMCPERYIIVEDHRTHPRQREISEVSAAVQGFASPTACVGCVSRKTCAT